MEKQKDLNIGLQGIDFSSSNLGCKALAYSLIDIIKKESMKFNRVIKYYLFYTPKKNDDINKVCEMFNIEKSDINIIEQSLKDIKKTRNIIKTVKKCDLIIDMSSGDSFTDLYGMKRMIKMYFYKNIAIKNKITLILGPQTYGPYNKWISKKLAKKILEKADVVFSRDEDSAKLVKNISGVTPIVSTDLAMRLPFDKNNKLNGKNIGISVSALMWYSTYGVNVKMDYKKYIESLIKQLKDTTEYNIYLISHVNAEFKEENDYELCEYLAKKFDVNLAPKFLDPIEAKNFIADLDIFIGSRMHATIAAFSSGVPVISVAYSKKFEGLYKSLDYNYFIDARKEKAESAIDKTIDLVNKVDDLAETQKKSLEKVQKKLNEFDNYIEKQMVKSINS